MAYNPFKGVGKVSGVVGGNFFPPDFKGIVRCEGVKVVISRNPKTQGDNKWIANFVIEECHSAPKSKGYLEPGSKRDWIVNLGNSPDEDNLTQKTQMGLNNVKAFAAVALGIPVEGVDDEILIGCANKEQLANGARLLLETSTIITRNNTPFTLHRFEPAPEGNGEVDPELEAEEIPFG